MSLLPRKIRILFLSQDRLTACLWNGRKLRHEAEWSGEELLSSYFTQYIAENPRIPLYFVLNTIGEPYHLERVPHVRWYERGPLLQRKLNQQFQAAKFRVALFQGRSSEGRRDDEVLFSSINDELLSRLVQEALKSRAKIVGISSEPLLTEFLVPRMRLDSVPHLLFVTVHAEGVRQTYMHHGKTRFSRFFSKSFSSKEVELELIRREIQDTRRFLERKRLVRADQRLDVHCFLESGHLLSGEVQFNLGDPAVFHTQTYELQILASHVGVTDPPFDVPLFSTCLIHALPTRGWPRHYADSETIRYQTVSRIKAAILTLSVLTLGCGLVMSGLNYHAMFQDRQQLGVEQALVLSMQQRLKENMARFPDTPVPAEDMEAIVRSLGRLHERGQHPTVLIALLGRTLTEFPSIAVKKLEWEFRVHDDPSNSIFEASSQPDMVISALLQSQFDESLILSAELDASRGPRAVIDQIHPLVAALERHPGIEVEILTMPLSLRADGRTELSVGAINTSEAEFSLRIVRRHDFPNSPDAQEDER